MSGLGDLWLRHTATRNDSWQSNANGGQWTFKVNFFRAPMLGKNLGINLDLLSDRLGNVIEIGKLFLRRTALRISTSPRSRIGKQSIKKSGAARNEQDNGRQSFP
jgi:hypothetical protein